MSQGNRNFVACRIKDQHTMDEFHSDLQKMNITADRLLNKILMAYYANRESYVLPEEVPKRLNEKKKPDPSLLTDKVMDKLSRNALSGIAKVANSCGVNITLTLKFSKIQDDQGPDITEDYLAVPDESPSEGMGK